MLVSSRRALLLSAASLLACSGISFSVTPSSRRFVLVLLRGGLDGLSLVPPVGDPLYRTARGEVAEQESLPLDARFSLHASLAPLMPLWESSEMLLFHAVGLPYRERSHFDAQNVLESGAERPFMEDTGWLSRAIAQMPGQSSALTPSRALPLALRGPARAANADLRRAPRLDTDLLSELRDLYRGDPSLGDALEEALSLESLVQRHRASSRAERDEMGTLGRLLADPEGPRIAVVERGGFDTHTNQRASLARELSSLGEDLISLRQGLGEAWSSTAVLAVTEFGRCVRGNGTGGTDHGVGSAALLLGGAVLGGRVVADWPGLSDSELYEGRDLAPTLDLRALFSATLSQHLGLDRALSERLLAGSSADGIGEIFRV